MRVYKGWSIIKNYPDKPFTGKTKKHFFSPHKKLFNGLWLTTYYKKNTQYYRKKAILFLMDYVEVAINECTVVSGVRYLEEKDLRVLKGKNTLVISCYSKQDGSYIGMPAKVIKLIEEKQITHYYGDERLDMAIVGYSPKNKKLYHWSGTSISEINTTEELTEENIKIIAKMIT